MSDKVKTSDVRVGAAVAGLAQLRLFCEVESAALSSDSARALETKIRELVTAKLVASGINIVNTPATPRLFVTVTARVVHANAALIAIIVRIDTAIREQVTLARLPAPGTMVAETWSHRPDVLICAGKQSSANIEAAVATAISKQIQALIDDKVNNNPLGDDVVAEYLDAAVHNPGGDAAILAHQRLSASYAKVCGNALPVLGDGSDFDRIWNSKVDPKASWLQYDANARGKGPVGALLHITKAKAIDKAGIWQHGLLTPGAVLQVWRNESDFHRISAGDPPQSLGHIMIFLRYVVEGEKIVGMRIADQGMFSAQVIKPSDFEYWCGGNLIC